MRSRIRRVALLLVALACLSAPRPVEAQQADLCQIGCVSAYAVCAYVLQSQYCDAAFQGCWYGCSL